MMSPKIRNAMGEKILKLLSGTNRDQGGQSLIMVTLLLFTLVCFLAFTINVGHRITKKIEIQNAADAATYSAATWNARGLNLICILNVSMAECLAWVIMANAYGQLLAHANNLLDIEKPIAEAMLNVPHTGPISGAIKFYGKVWDEALVIAGKAKVNFVDYFNKGLHSSIDPTWDFMKTLRKLEDGTRFSFPKVAFYRSSFVAKKNNANEIFETPSIHALVFPMNSLPTEGGDFKDLCQPTRVNGSWVKRENYQEQLNFAKALDMRAVPIETLVEGLWQKIVSVMPRPLEDALMKMWAGKSTIQVRKIFYATLLTLNPTPLGADIAEAIVGFRIPTFVSKAISSVLPLGILPAPAEFWDDYIDWNAEKLCTGLTPPMKTVKIPAENWQSCVENDGEQVWRSDGWVELNEKGKIDSKKDPGYVTSWCGDRYEEPSKVYEQKGHPPAGKIIPDGIVTKNEEYKTMLCKVVCICGQEPDCMGCEYDEEEPPVYGTKKVQKYFGRQWFLVECMYEEVISPDTAVGSDGIPLENKTPNDEEKPSPLVLTKDFAKNLKFTGFVKMDVTDRWSLISKGKKSLKGGDQAVVAVARAEVYNPSSEDLFNQDWRVKLSPCTIEDLNLDVFDVSDELLPYLPENVKGDLLEHFKIELNKIAGDLLLH